MCEGENLRRSELLNAQSSQPLSHVDTGGEVLALHDTGQKTSGKGVTGTVGVVDVFLGDGVNRELLDLVLTLDGDQGRLGALGDNGDSLSLAILLWQVSEVLDDIPGILGGQVVRLGVGSGLGLVTEDEVPVRGASVNGILEELGNERSGQRQDKYLVFLSGLFGKLHNGRGADYTAKQNDD